MIKRGNVLSPELTQAVQQVVRQYLTSIQPRPKTAKKRHNGIASAPLDVTQLAIVMEAAGASTYSTTAGITGGSTGKAVLLKDEDGNLVPTVELDTGSGDYDVDAVADAEIEFKSALRVGCPVGAIVELSSSDELTPGSTFEEVATWGQLIDAADYPNFTLGNDQSLGHDADSYYEWQDDVTCP